MARRAKQSLALDAELDDLPPELRWREWMGRVEAAIFASPTPVAREKLAALVGAGCNLELLIDDIRAELRLRPYDLVCVASGWQHRTRDRFGAAIQAVLPAASPDLGKTESLVLAAIAYFQPATRADLSEILGREVSRDLIARLREEELIAAGPYAYVTTRAFLARFGFESLRDLPDMEQLEDAGLLHKADRMEKIGAMWDGLVAAEEGSRDADDGENRDGLNGADGAVELDQD